MSETTRTLFQSSRGRTGLRERQQESPREQLRLAVLLPCYNEAAAISRVVREFRQHVPGARVYVYDNNSADDTCTLASAAGATVCHEAAQGKGNVVRRMFADIEADVYVMADGDGTYDASAAPRMIEVLVGQRLDMVVGTRLGSTGDAVFRFGHRFGNETFARLIGALFGTRYRDVLSGFRVFSRRFVKSFPALSRGFEIESELTIHAMELRMPVAEVEIPYFRRVEGSASKLGTFSDGVRILWMVLMLTKELRPVWFFGSLACAVAGTSVALSYPLIVTFVETGLVPRFPTAILAAGLMVLAFVSLTCGLILDSVSTGRWEAKRMAYLAVPRTAGEIGEVAAIR